MSLDEALRDIIRNELRQVVREELDRGQAKRPTGTEEFLTVARAADDADRGLVHGGAHCRIATPGDRLARLVDRVLERESTRAVRIPLIASERSGSPAS